ncbi:MAG TPA: penicillin-binding transpeptidase domain-containing protein [Solirubrobacteraceae bacterium]|jgi:peptidoglycan glycosyltransferase|nr:penicillin-binding transpeptidase domain-containing protein [Solirubrobacteraceae bacterium]
MSAAPLSGRGGPDGEEQGGVSGGARSGTHGAARSGTHGGARGGGGDGYDGAHARSRRARPMMALALVAFAAGAIVGAAQSGSSSASALASSFAAAWARGDYAAMYSEIAPASQRTISVGEFASAYREAAMLATASATRVMGPPRAAADGVEVVPVRIATRLFGSLASSFRLPIVAAPNEEGSRVAWSRALVFPGLRAGERLSRRTALPARAPLLARDGSVLAEGSASAAGERSSPLGAAASAAVGSVGAIPANRLAALEAQGVEADAIVGVSGLELAEDERLRGTPGGELLAIGTDDERVLTSAPAHAGTAVRTSISPAVQSAAVSALGGQYGGVVAMEPASGQILGVAGIGLDALQPPGSTFKMVTVTGVLQAGVANPRTTFPYATSATLDGVQLHNSESESCGGTLTEAFAVSCNSVFAPLGVKLGASRLVATAERFGFNQPVAIPGAAQSTIPAASGIQGELAVGSSAIGQDEVLASPLEMTVVAATIADAGRRPTPTFDFGEAASAGASASGTTGAGGGKAGGAARVMSAATARAVRSMMIDVVRFGTGTAAAIPGVVVAGKTGTAELGGASSGECAGSEEKAGGDTSTTGAQESEAGHCASEQNSPQNTDAWFASFAPALHPKIVVGVLLVRDGFGGDTAAPVAREVLEAGLKSGS